MITAQIPGKPIRDRSVAAVAATFLMRIDHQEDQSHSQLFDQFLDQHVMQFHHYKHNQQDGHLFVQ
jgi:hypothetical protein